MRRYLLYETYRISARVGSSSSFGDWNAPGWQGSHRGSGSGGVCPIFRFTVEDGAGGRGRESASSQAPPRTQASFVSRAEGTPRQDSSEGASRGGVRNGSLDVFQGRQGHPKNLWGALSPGSRLEDSEESGLELSEARTTSSGAKRESHRLLASRGLAGLKKKGGPITPPLSFWTRAGSSCNRWSAVRGRPGGKPRSTIRGTAMTASPSSRRSPFRPNNDAWAFTSASIPKTSRRPWWKTSSPNCIGVWGET